MTASTPRRLIDLSPTERRHAMLGATARCLATVLVMLTLYYVLPLSEHIANGAVLIRLFFGAIVFVAVMIWQLRRIISAELPELRAIETLAIGAALFLIIYAAVYVTLSRLNSSSFSERLDHTGGLYFVLVTFSTVGFGDIVPKSDTARVLVSLQIVCDLIFIGAIVRLIFGLSRRSLERGDAG